MSKNNLVEAKIDALIEAIKGLPDESKIQAFSTEIGYGKYPIFNYPTADFKLLADEYERMRDELKGEREARDFDIEHRFPE